MDGQLKGITSGYHERMHRIGLFEPLYKLKNKTGKDKSGEPIDYYGLGMLTLLFFFEHMLMRKKAGVRELARYLAGLAGDVITLDASGYENLARLIIETFRPPLGKRSTHIFYNWETRQMEQASYSYLKAAKHDLETYSQYYVLDEHGLELVFATKEFFSEFQLSINQLLLRKQLEKGEFVGALRQIEEMRMNVEQLQERMRKVKQEIQRNIISDESYQRYEQTIQDVHQRLRRENEEFEELLAFVHETRDRLGYEKTDRRDQRAYELILKIDGELGEVHHQHSLLLKKSIELNTTVLKAARESLYFVAVNSFNFDQEIVSKLITVPLPVKTARVLVEPFLSLEQHRGWSPLTVFAPQYIGGDDPLNDDGEFLSISSEEQRLLEQKIQKQNFTQIMELINRLFKEPVEFTLRQMVEQLKICGRADMLDHRSFYDFWLLLHQNSPLNIAKFSHDEQVAPFAGAQQVFGAKARKITVEELPEIVSVNERYEIQNFIFCLGR
ncbi:replicative DNA helicase [Desulfoscipio sp. XC116]|uniref:replicative DNA helicase n=1 Tax=Desulfoscipio sp. XC116 TaxID=3144975 RepID=UPI00325B07B8